MEILSQILDLCLEKVKFIANNHIQYSSVARGGALGARAPPLARVTCIVDKYKKQLQKIERKVGMEYQKAYKQG